MKICIASIAFFLATVSVVEGFSVASLHRHRTIGIAVNGHQYILDSEASCLAKENACEEVLGFQSGQKVANLPNFGKMAMSALLLVSVSLSLSMAPTAAWAGLESGASSGANWKITTGGASTSQTGRTISITRGVNLDREDFSNLNLKGVAFQQSIVRDANFKNSNLVGASFFDATVDGSDFENADLSQANFEMAQFNRASLKNAVVREMYVSGSTLFEGIKDIENTDWSDTYLRRDQRKYLCAHPTAKGTNPKTGVDTRESLMCID